MTGFVFVLMIRVFMVNGDFGLYEGETFNTVEACKEEVFVLVERFKELGATVEENPIKRAEFGCLPVAIPGEML